MNPDDIPPESRSFMPPSTEGDSYRDEEHEVDVPLNPSDLWGPDSLGLVTEVDAMIAMFAAQRFERVYAFRVEQLREYRQSAMDDRVLDDFAERSIRLELACALKISEHAVERLVTLSVSLVERYPAVLDSMGCGNVSERHVTTLVDAANEIAEEHRDVLVTQGLAWAQELPFGTFRRKLRAFVAELQVQTIEEQHAAAFADRRVSLEAAANGMAWLHLLTSEVNAHAIYHRVTAMGKAVGVSDPDDERTIDQRRADVVTGLLLDGDTGSLPTAARGIRPTVAVTVPVLSLLGLDTEPATVDGIGPIPLSMARQLCGTADSWMRVLTHPESGVVLSVGRDTYRPPADLRRFVKWRAARCMAPGCHIPASRCEDDHTQAWEHGGTTSSDNLCPLCVGHHHVKHHTPWKVTQASPADGSLIWRSPTGRSYTVHPERRTPTFIPDRATTPSIPSISGADDTPPPF